MQCTGQKANLEIVFTIVRCSLRLHRHRRVVLRLAQLPFVSIVTGLRSSLIADVKQPLLLADTNDFSRIHTSRRWEFPDRRTAKAVVTLTCSEACEVRSWSVSPSWLDAGYARRVSRRPCCIPSSRGVTRSGRVEAALSLTLINRPLQILHRTPLHPHDCRKFSDGSIYPRKKPRNPASYGCVFL